MITFDFFSMSETAFSSSNDAKLRVLIEERKAGAKKALSMTTNFDKTLITLLIGNNLVNVALSTLAVLFFSELIKSESVVSVVSTAVITITLLIFGEIVPYVKFQNLYHIHSNHLHSKINNYKGSTITSMTSRYRIKFSTFIYYKPNVIIEKKRRVHSRTVKLRKRK